MLRAVAILAALVPASLLGMAAQGVLLLLRAPAARRLPILYHRLVCALLGVRRTVIGRPASARPLLVVANHISWLDIPVIGAEAPVSFVARHEVAGWPVIGWFAKLQRSVFVNRTRRTDTARVNAEIAGRLRAGDAIVLFAEGTSSDGSRVLPFRSSILGAAREALREGAGTVWVQPLAIVYTHSHGLPLDRRLRPRIAWYGAMDLGPHLWGLLKSGRIDVTLVWGEPVGFGPGAERKAVTQGLEGAVRRAAAAVLRGRSRASRCAEAR
jgi:1-acyl-sn-glycerol-3-phosphate acyltransferase